MDKPSYNKAIEDVRNELIGKARTMHTDGWYDPLVVDWKQIRSTLDRLEKQNVESTKEDRERVT